MAIMRDFPTGCLCLLTCVFVVSSDVCSHNRMAACIDDLMWIRLYNDTLFQPSKENCRKHVEMMKCLKHHQRCEPQLKIIVALNRQTWSCKRHVNVARRLKRHDYHWWVHNYEPHTPVVIRHAVDGHYGPWGAWTSCSSEGTQFRLRHCNDPTPRHGGKPCEGNWMERRNCAAKVYPVHGKFGEWSFWYECSQTCGEGDQYRMRRCDNPQPQNGGRQCQGNHQEKRTCRSNSCPVDGQFGDWSVWSACSKSCAHGDQYQERTCSNPSPANGGRACMGRKTRKQSCNKQKCPVHGQYGEWSAWSNCSPYGVSARKRRCNRPAPAYDGDRCAGRSTETTRCANGHYGPWTAWSECSRSCGHGVRYQTHRCDSPRPTRGGKPCKGPDRREKVCIATRCPVNGGYSDWGVWGNCTQQGVRRRVRLCDNPTPAHNGTLCSGQSQQLSICVHGVFSVWSPWTSCHVIGNTTVRNRTRRCDNPRPANGGRQCSGNTEEHVTCVDGGLGAWLQWSTCDVRRHRRRHRLCDSPAPSNGGRPCDRNDTESENCVDGGYSEWGQWSSCIAFLRTRDRQCDNPAPSSGGRYCDGSPTDSQVCTNGEWSEWQTWSSCPLTLQRARIRTCDNPPPTNAGAPCMGDSHESESCVNGGFGQWSQWMECLVDVTGQTASRLRHRRCDTPAPSIGGNGCVGNSAESQSCSNGGFSDWGSWSTCITNAHLKRRSRQCDNPAPANGGTDCQGTSVQLATCP